MTLLYHINNILLLGNENVYNMYPELDKQQTESINEIVIRCFVRVYSVCVCVCIVVWSILGKVCKNVAFAASKM